MLLLGKKEKRDSHRSELSFLGPTMSQSGPPSVTTESLKLSELGKSPSFLAKIAFFFTDKGVCKLLTGFPPLSFWQLEKSLVLEGLGANLWLSESRMVHLMILLSEPQPQYSDLHHILSQTKMPRKSNAKKECPRSGWPTSNCILQPG